MSADVGRVALRLRCARGAQMRAKALARDVRAALPEAFAVAAAERPERGIVVVPHITVSLRAPLRRIRGRDIACALARGCIDAAAARSIAIVAATDSDGTAQRCFEALRSGDGVRFASPAAEGAAWLVALILDAPVVLRALSPFADLEHRASGAAFAAVCERTRDGPAVVRALGRRWARALAGRCSDAEAARVLGALCTGNAPDPAAWAFVAERMLQSAPGPTSRVTRALAAAIEGTFAGVPGVAEAARALVEARIADAAAATAALTSNLTGFWLLLPHLPFAGVPDARIARAVAYAAGRALAGAFAADDPALAALCAPGESIRDLECALPSDARIGRVIVSAVRSFAQRLRHFENARCGYILSAILSGPGTVRRTAAGWTATLPQAPLRVVLERATLLGPLDVPWTEPALAIVRDDD